VARACAFCEREEPLTLEHAFPRWIGALFPPADSITHKHTSEGKVLWTHTAKELDAKVRRVCVRCNTGWMHQLEGLARPVISPLVQTPMFGRRRGLMPTEQEIIALWAVKTALMCEFLHTPSRSAPQEHFRAIYRSKKPPITTTVWVGAYDGRKELDYNHRRLRIETTDPSMPYTQGYLTAFLIGRLALYVMGSEEPATMHLSNHAQRAVIEVWPRQHLLPRWPPQVILDDEGIEGFLLSVAPDRFEG
jgi:hypothetical protein